MTQNRLFQHAHMLTSLCNGLRWVELPSVAPYTSLGRQRQLQNWKIQGSMTGFQTVEELRTAINRYSTSATHWNLVPSSDSKNQARPPEDSNLFAHSAKNARSFELGTHVLGANMGSIDRIAACRCLLPALPMLCNAIAKRTYVLIFWIKPNSTPAEACAGSSNLFDKGAAWSTA